MRNDPPVPEPESFEHKEVWAFYGWASYAGQIFEKGVLNWLVGLDVASTGGPKENQQDPWERFDRNTLGQLLTRIRKYVEIPPDMDQRLQEALKKRNFLAHHFFARHAEDMFSEDGRSRMLTELQGLIRLFKSADDLVDTVSLPLWARLGITQEIVDRECDRMEAKSRGDLTGNGGE